MVKCIHCKNKVLFNGIWICKFYKREINFKELILCDKYKKI